MSPLVVSDAALADADGVFRAFVEHLARKYATIRRLDPSEVPRPRAEAVAALDRWEGGGGWRAEALRFYEAHAPVLLRPDAELNGAIRRAVRAGASLRVVSPLPGDVVALYLAHLGLARAVGEVAGEVAVPPGDALGSRAELRAALSR